MLKFHVRSNLQVPSDTASIALEHSCPILFPISKFRPLVPRPSLVSSQILSQWWELDYNCLWDSMISQARWDLQAERLRIWATILPFSAPS
jgi:hypothetical protein